MGLVGDETGTNVRSIQEGKRLAHPRKPLKVFRVANARKFEFAKDAVTIQENGPGIRLAHGNHLVAKLSKRGAALGVRIVLVDALLGFAAAVNHHVCGQVRVAINDQMKRLADHIFDEFWIVMGL